MLEGVLELLLEGAYYDRMCVIIGCVSRDDKCYLKYKRVSQERIRVL